MLKLIKKIIVSMVLVMTLSLYTNVIFASWPQHIIWKPSGSSDKAPDGVFIAKIDGDSDYDVVSPLVLGGKTMVLFNPGASSNKNLWTEKETLNSGNGAEGAVAVDIDGDTYLDIVTACIANEKDVVIHWSTSNYEYPDTESSAFTNAAGKPWLHVHPYDINEDGKKDLIIGSRDNQGKKLGWLEHPGGVRNDSNSSLDPNIMSNWDYHPIGDTMKGKWIMNVLMVDVDDDGDDDIIASKRENDNHKGIWIHVNPGTSGNQKAEWEGLHVDSTNRTQFAAYDILDGSGNHYLVAGVHNQKKIKVYKKNSNKSDDYFDAPIVVDYSNVTIDGKNIANAKGIAIGDIDGDCKNDIVLTTVNGSGTKHNVIWISHDDTGSGDVIDSNTNWTYNTISGTSSQNDKYDNVILVDMDGDCDKDVLTSEQQAGTSSRGIGVMWYENTATTQCCNCPCP